MYCSRCGTPNNPKPSHCPECGSLGDGHFRGCSRLIDADALFTTETYVNDTEGHIFSESGKPEEAFTDDISKVYRYGMREYGKPSAMYMDYKDGRTEQCGWVFTKQDKYDLSDEYYTRSVWVTVYTVAPCPECGAHKLIRANVKKLQRKQRNAKRRVA